VGQNLSGLTNSSCTTKLSEVEGLSFLRNGVVTYVTNHEVTKRHTDFGH
jgi:hypothetical protein